MSEQLKDRIHATGRVIKRLYDENGVLKLEQIDSNLVVTAGTNYLAAWLVPSSQSTYFMSYVGLGTSSTPPSSGDTALGAELSGGGYSRQQGTLSSSGSVWQNVSTFGPGNGTAALTEAGLFNVSTSGTLFAHQVFSTINKSSGDTLVITWQVTF